MDLFADILNDAQPASIGNLLSHVQDRPLILDKLPAQASHPAHPLLIVDTNQAAAVVSKIEGIFEKIAACILDEKKALKIQLKTRGKKAATEHDAITGAIKNVQDDDVRTIKFPSKSPKEAWRFTALLRILELSHEALVDGVVTTKRDMFYRDPELFVKQAVVDRYVDDLAYTLGVQRDALNVVAAAKGLVAGSFKLERRDGSVVDYSVEPGGVLVPHTRDLSNIQMLEIQWILIIEKEATFRTLATSKYWSLSRAGKGIIITAKGYPDIQSRQLLRLLSNHSPLIPIFALTDFDPDGLGIMSTYKYGSMALAHENMNLAVPSTRWLGIRSSDILSDEKWASNRKKDRAGLLKLSARDRRIAMRMLEKEMFEEGGREEEWRRELQVMLLLNVKAEIQILNEGGGLEGWLDEKLADGVAAIV